MAWKPRSTVAVLVAVAALGAIRLAVALGGKTKGFTSYKVANTVTSHEAWGCTASSAMRL